MRIRVWYVPYEYGINKHVYGTEHIQQLVLNSGTVLFTAAVTIKLWCQWRVTHCVLVTNIEQTPSHDTQHVEVKLQ